MQQKRSYSIPIVIRGRLEGSFPPSIQAPFFFASELLTEKQNGSEFCAHSRVPFPSLHADQHS